MRELCLLLQSNCSVSSAVVPWSQEIKLFLFLSPSAPFFFSLKVLQIAKGLPGQRISRKLWVKVIYSLQHGITARTGQCHRTVLSEFCSSYSFARHRNELFTNCVQSLLSCMVNIVASSRKKQAGN